MEVFHTVDDIFIIWTGTRDELTSFLNGLENNSYNLKFTLTCNQKTIDFLDFTVYVNQNGTMGSSLHKKTLGGNTILHATSSHPESFI